METSRRGLFSTLAAAGLTCFTTGASYATPGRELFGRFNFRTMDFYPFTHADVIGGKCLVDGEEIKNVWFADTEMGIVRTYDVLHDGSLATATAKGPGCLWHPSDFPGREVECPWDGALSETLRGRVQIFGPAND